MLTALCLIQYTFFFVISRTTYDVVDDELIMDDIKKN